MDYVGLIGLGINFLQYLIPSLTKAKAPVEVVNAVAGAATALVAHRDDVVNKANLEAQRG